MYDYDAWKTGWYDIGAPIHECDHCNERDQTIDEAGNHLEAVIKQLYASDTLDTGRLEKSLEELCHLLHVKIHPGMLQVERKGKRAEIRREAALDAWKSFNLAYTQQAL